jgi:hypothetical protein
MDENEAWFDEEAGPLIRPFALTRGRAPTDRHNLEMITLVVAARPYSDATASSSREYSEILRMCQSRPMSVAEISAQLNMLLAVVKVLISDLIDAGDLILPSTPSLVETPDLTILQAVLDGVRRL